MILVGDLVWYFVGHLGEEKCVVVGKLVIVKFGLLLDFMYLLLDLKLQTSFIIILFIIFYTFGFFLVGLFFVSFYISMLFNLYFFNKSCYFFHGNIVLYQTNINVQVKEISLYQH